MHAHTTSMCVHALVVAFSFTTSQMKSLHYDQCFFDIHRSRWTSICALFHRDETKPTHIIGINAFLFFIQLIYKHSSPNYQHMTSSGQLINKMLVLLRIVCAYVETFSTAFTSLPVVMLSMQLIRLSCEISIYDEQRKVDEAASTNLLLLSFFSHHTSCISHC